MEIVDTKKGILKIRKDISYAKDLNVETGCDLDWGREVKIYIFDKPSLKRMKSYLELGSTMPSNL